MFLKCRIKKVCDWFKYDLPQGFINLKIWFPIIWKDRNWDYSFIYILLRHKLHLTEHLIRNHGHHLYKDKDADNIKLCVNLLDRLIEDDYHKHAFKAHDKKWGEADFQWKDTKDAEFVEMLIKHENVKTPKDKEKEKEDFKRAINHEDHLKKQDLDMLFNTMRKHIQGWWD